MEKLLILYIKKIKFELNLNIFEEIIVYQFGKVGSRTLQHTFAKYSSLVREVKHSHNFNDLIGLKTTKPVLIVNVVRNLFDRNISAMFQNIYKNNINDSYINKKGFTREGCFLGNTYAMEHFKKSGDIDKLSNFFKKVNTEILLKKLNNKWYSDFNKKLGINIFETPFDSSIKYKIITESNKTISIKI